jgi:hypothetical protein
VMLSGTSSLLVVCHPALSSSRTAWAPSATLREISSRWSLHHVGVDIRRCQCGSDAPRGADRAEQIGVVIALVGELARPGSAPGPLPNLAILLADAGLVLKPDFDRRGLRQSFEVSLQCAREAS